MKQIYERKKVFQKYILKENLKATKQRNIIFDKFFSYHGRHLTIEELYESVKKYRPKIGYATVYRTLKLFKECGIAIERNFGDGRSRYEPIKFQGEHHEHLICIECGKIIEFESQQVECHSMETARINDFKVTSHKLEIYGYCSSCKDK